MGSLDELVAEVSTYATQHQGESGAGGKSITKEIKSIKFKLEFESKKRVATDNKFDKKLTDTQAQLSRMSEELQKLVSLVEGRPQDAAPVAGDADAEERHGPGLRDAGLAINATECKGEGANQSAIRRKSRAASVFCSSPGRFELVK
eukprot:4099511-Prymnesium_polylepis.1